MARQNFPTAHLQPFQKPGRRQSQGSVLRQQALIGVCGEAAKVKERALYCFCCDAASLSPLSPTEVGASPHVSENPRLRIALAIRPRSGCRDLLGRLGLKPSGGADLPR